MKGMCDPKLLRLCSTNVCSLTPTSLPASNPRILFAQARVRCSCDCQIDDSICLRPLLWRGRHRLVVTDQERPNWTKFPHSFHWHGALRESHLLSFVCQ